MTINRTFRPNYSSCAAHDRHSRPSRRFLALKVHLERYIGSRCGCRRIGRARARVGGCRRAGPARAAPALAGRGAVMEGCPGCRYCEWLPQATRQLDGCPARNVTSAVAQAVQVRKKKRRRQREQCGEDVPLSPNAAVDAAQLEAFASGGERTRSRAARADAGCTIFGAEYSQSVRAVDAALLRKAGGVQSVLKCMWDSIPAQRRAKYTAFAHTHGIPSTLPDAVAQDAIEPSCQTHTRVQYFSVSQNWPKFAPHFKSEEARALWLPAMCQLWLERRGYSSTRRQSMSTESIVAELLRLPSTPDGEMNLLPCHLEASDWRHSARSTLLQPGSEEVEQKHETQSNRSMLHAEPPFWGWVCEGACHKLVPLYLWIVRQVEPAAAWRVITSDAHSAVWDGQLRLFDPIFEAMGIQATEAFRRAGGGTGCCS